MEDSQIYEAIMNFSEANVFMAELHIHQLGKYESAFVLCYGPLGD